MDLYLKLGCFQTLDGLFGPGVLLLLQSPWTVKSVWPKLSPSFAVGFGESGPSSGQSGVLFLKPRAKTLC